MNRMGVDINIVNIHPHKGILFFCLLLLREMGQHLLPLSGSLRWTGGNKDMTDLGLGITEYL